MTNHTSPAPLTCWTALVERALAGERSAMDELVDAAMPIVRGTVRRMASGPDADDIVQDAMVDLVSNLRSIREPERFAGWVRTVARHAACRYFKRNRRLLPVGSEPTRTPAAADCSTIDDLIDRMAAKTAMSSALSTLTHCQRQVLDELMATDAASYEHIARRLGRPIGSLGPTRNRALAQLRTDRNVLALVG